MRQVEDRKHSPQAMIAAAVRPLYSEPKIKLVLPTADHCCCLSYSTLRPAENPAIQRMLLTTRTACVLLPGARVRGTSLLMPFYQQLNIALTELWS